MLERTVFLAAALAAALACAGAAAQSYPNRAVTLLVGFAPGGSTDLAARALAEKMSGALGQPVVVLNKPGASGNIAADLVAHAAPDGYTLLMAATSFAAAPAFFDKLTWDPVKDFAPVALVASVPIVVVVNGSLPVKTPRELIAYSKANAGRINLATPGAATLTGLSGGMFARAAGLDWVTVNYTGGAPAMQDLLGGRAQVMFGQIPDVIGQLGDGRLRAIAVTTPTRTAILPDVPTLAESGFPRFSFSGWQAVLGTAGMPPEVVARLNRGIVTAMSTQEMKDRFRIIGVDATTSTPGELGAYIAEEVAKIGQVAATVGVKVH